MKYLRAEANPNLFELVIDRVACEPLTKKISEFCGLLEKLPDDNNLKTDFYICVNSLLDEAEKNAFDKGSMYQAAIMADEQQMAQDYYE